MCGIHFILDKNKRLTEEPVQKMINSTVYRGPDDFGFQVFESPSCMYFLGANRLRITDVTKYANQPFTSGDGFRSLVYNGELYNYSVLKSQQLKDGKAFRSGSDTEVLFNVLAENQEKGLEKLNGMYSFVYLNKDTDNVLLARDSWGMKPLYYYEDSDFFIASSEIKAILASGLVNKVLNEKAVHDYLQYRYVCRPDTFFENIMEFETGSFIQIRNGKITKNEIIPQTEYDPDCELYRPDQCESEIVLQAEKLLVKSLLYHLPANGSAGLFLSGGVDSTLMLALLNENGYSNFPAYSFVTSVKDRSFGTKDYKYATLAAKMYHAEHHQIETNASMLENIDDYICRIDQPVGDSGALMTYLLSQEVAKNHKIVLSGAGADEMFGGYNRHAAFRTYLKNYKFLSLIKEPGIFGANMFAAVSNERGRLIKKFFTNLDKDPSVTYNKFISFDQLTSRTDNSLWPSDGNENINYHLGKALEHDRTNYLVSDVLTISDRMTMLAGIEMRLPYLDRELSRYARSLPPKLLLANGKKWILKEMLQKRNGEIFCRRSKEGFGLPFGAWTDINHTGAWSFLESENSLVFKFIEKNRILELKSNHQKSKANYTLELWAVMVLAKWLDITFV